jgi:hypothetical protein
MTTVMGSPAALESKPEKTSRYIIPREHGAWAVLLLPFVSALVLARQVHWAVIPAALLVVGVFLLREPLVVLWRQASVWKERRPESEAARRSLILYLAVIIVSGALLLWRLPLWAAAALGAPAGALTLASVFLTVHNRQRSVLLQLASAAGLSASAVVAWLAVRPQLDPALGWLWALQFAHSGAALLAVHARLEARIAARGRSEAAVMQRRAIAAQAVLLAAAAGCAAAGRIGPAVALCFSGGVHMADLMRLRSAASLGTPLRRVGLRELTISVIFSAMVVAGLW